MTAVAPVLGGALGVLAKLGDESGERWAADLGTYPGFWAALVVLIGWLSRSMAGAALNGALVFVGMVSGYYLWTHAVLGYGGGPFELVWATLAVALCPALAAASWWATRRPGLLPAIVLAVPAGLTLASGPVNQVFLVLEGLLPEPTHWAQAIFDLVFAVLIVLVLPRHASTRLWGAFLCVPASLLAASMLEQVVYGSGLL
jgi:Family of unknown function (DUF6518)